MEVANREDLTNEASCPSRRRRMGLDEKLGNPETRGNGTHFIEEEEEKHSVILRLKYLSYVARYQKLKNQVVRIRNLCTRTGPTLLN